MNGQRIAMVARIALGLVLASAATVHAQDSESGGQIALDRLAYIQPGTYLAGDTVAFELDDAGRNYLLRFAGSPEVFVLTVDRGSLGGRVLKYDSGETVLNVAGWGGLTLYTDSAPQGLPAVRTGEAAAPVPSDISLPDMQSAARDEAGRLAYQRRIEVQFAANWNALAANPDMRAFAFDAMENAVRGIARFTAAAFPRDAFARRISLVTISPGARPFVVLNGRSLMVTFNPSMRFAGCASSRAVARALGALLSR